MYGMGRLRRTSHIVYELNYHVVWAPKYRKWLLVGEIKKRLEELFHEVANEYGFEILEQSIEKNHAHVFVSVPPRIAPSRVVQILKSISGREIFREFPHLRRKLWGGELWEDGYFVRAVGDKLTTAEIGRYVRYQQHEAKAIQPSLFSKMPPRK